MSPKSTTPPPQRQETQRQEAQRLTPEHPPLQSNPRERILEVAVRLFYEQGYQATGINQIIREASVAKASFYHHFPSKLDLIVAHLERCDDDWFSELTDAIDVYREPHRRVLALVDHVGQWLKQRDYRGCAFLNSLPEFSDPQSRPRQIVREHKLKQRRLVADLCAEAQRPELADRAFLLVEGAISQVAVVGTLQPLDLVRDLVERELSSAVPSSPHSASRRPGSAPGETR
ncbi:MAG: TetR/AcrR family transcriptional regulator [Acidobacteriota bacterium]